MRILPLSLLLALTLAGCGESSGTKTTAEAEAPAAGEYERGPHNGRLLRDGNFALEMTVFEDGVPPEYRLFAYRDDSLHKGWSRFYGDGGEASQRLFDIDGDNRLDVIEPSSSGDN